MRDLNYRPVADKEGRFLPWVNSLANQSGAYVIRDARSSRVLYIGESHSGTLAKTLKRHFHEWRDDAERRHHVYDRHRVTVAIRLTPPPAAVGAQDNLIRRLSPKDNGYTPVKNPF